MVAEEQLCRDGAGEIAEVFGEMDQQVVNGDDPDESSGADDGQAAGCVRAEQRVGIVEICGCVDGDDGHAHDRIDARVGRGAGGECATDEIPVVTIPIAGFCRSALTFALWSGTTTGYVLGRVAGPTRRAKASRGVMSR